MGITWIPPGRCQLFSSYKLQPGAVNLGAGEFQYLGPRSCGGGTTCFCILYHRKPRFPDGQEQWQAAVRQCVLGPAGHPGDHLHWRCAQESGAGQYQPAVQVVKVCFSHLSLLALGWI